jgi:hypothetical protein
VERTAAEVRKRAEREARLRPKLRQTDSATDAWSATHATLTVSVPRSSFMLWLHPLNCIGEAENALCLSAPDHVQSWCERRYGRLIGETVRSLSDFAGVYLLRDEPATEEDTPL